MRLSILGLWTAACVSVLAVTVAVMSVDLGSEWMKMAIVKPGVPMEIVLNKWVFITTISLPLFMPDVRWSYFIWMVDWNMTECTAHLTTVGLSISENVKWYRVKVLKKPICAANVWNCSIPLTSWLTWGMLQPANQLMPIRKLYWYYPNLQLLMIWFQFFLGYFVVSGCYISEIRWIIIV